MSSKNGNSISYGLRILLALLVMCLFSWILVHILAVMGAFLAVGYLMRVYVVYYRKNGDGPSLLFPRWLKGMPVSRSEKYLENDRKKGMPPLAIVATNFFLILVLTALSYVIVRIELKGLDSSTAQSTKTEVSFDIPARGQYRLGDVIPMPINVSGISKNINLVQADLSFDPGKLEVVSVSTSGSFADIFVQRDVDNAKGYVRLTGGLANPGYSGKNGLFGTVYFKAKQTGVAQVNYLPSSMVLVNDGSGSNILKKYGSVPLAIVPTTPVESPASSPTSTSETKSNFSDQVQTKDDTQLLFYDDSPITTVPSIPVPPSATPTPSPQAEETPARNAIFRGVLDIIRMLDQQILEVWMHAFSPFK